MSTLSLAHACIKTTSLEQTEAFYCEVLGLKKHFEFTRKDKVIGLYLKGSNDSFIEVFLTDEVENTNSRCLNHFCLETDDLAALRQRLVDRGYKPGEINTGADETLQFWTTDPNGLAVEFQQYTARSAQYTGANVEVNW
jgi:lactoylglutathione lyase/glyoxylase I family protein